MLNWKAIAEEFCLSGEETDNTGYEVEILHGPHIVFPPFEGQGPEINFICRIIDSSTNGTDAPESVGDIITAVSEGKSLASVGERYTALNFYDYYNNGGTVARFCLMKKC